MVVKPKELWADLGSWVAGDGHGTGDGPEDTDRGAVGPVEALSLERVEELRVRLQGAAATAAQVNLYYPPEPGRTRPKVVSIEVTSKGRLNLHKFDAKMQAQLEGYLVAVGILQKGQTLSAHEVPPEADAISSSPVIED